MTVSATPRALELEIVERARAWRAIDGELQPDAKRGAEEALVEAIDELERQLRNSKSAASPAIPDVDNRTPQQGARHLGWKP